MIAAADAHQENKLGSLFKERLPRLEQSLQADSHRQAWKRLWGQSINFDELAKGIIVHPAILSTLGKSFGIRMPMTITHFRSEKTKEGTPFSVMGEPVTTDPAGHPLAHAGLEHTYGYLFSVLKTSFGYKRARWVQGEIEAGFGLKPGLIGPTPTEGTLFANVTYFAGRIAFRGEDTPTLILKDGTKDLPHELREFDFTRLSPIRLIETVQAKDSTGDTRQVVLRTDLVPFFHPQKDTHLLVYSVDDPSYGGPVLITAFPVNQAFVDTVTKAETLGENQPVQTRYNAFVEGITGYKLTGTRKLTQ